MQRREALTVDRDLQACPHPGKDILTQLSGRFSSGYKHRVVEDEGRGGYIAKLWLSSISCHIVIYQAVMDQFT